MKRLSSILVLALLAVSCSSGTSNSSHPNTEDGLREAATSHFNAFIKSPMNTYQFLSKDCQSAVSKSEYNGQMLMASGMFESFLGVKLSDVKIGEVVISNFSPGSGEVSFELLGPDGEQITDSSDATKYVYEDDGGSEYGDKKEGLVDQLGAFHKEAGAALRATFIVDPDNVIQHVTVNNLNVGRNADETLRVLDALQTEELCQCNRQVGEATLNAA